MASTEGDGDEVRRRLQATDPYEFEHFVADVWEHRGWDTTVSQGSNDRGVDVVAEKSDGLVETKQVIQAKRHADGNKVGRPRIQQYHTLKEQDADADAAVVVTTSSFTDTAESWAREHNVKLVDGDDLVELIEEENLEPLVDNYAPDELPERTEEKTETASEKGSTTTTSSSKSGSSYIGVVFWLVLLQIACVIVGFRPSWIPLIGTQAATWIGVFAYLATAPGVFLDAVAVHRAGAAKRPNRILWPAVAFFLPIIGPGYYLIVRGQTSS